MAKRNQARRHATPVIALFVDIVSDYGRDILAGIATYVRNHEPWTIFGDPERVMTPVEQLQRWRGDGVIAHVSTDTMARAAEACGVPVVNVSQYLPDAPFPSVLPDNAAVGRIAAEYLLARGYEHFAYCGFIGHGYAEARLASFAGRLLDEGHQVQVNRSEPPQERAEQWDRRQADLASWVRSLPKPVGLMCCNDTRARHVTQACVTAGVRVPEDVAIIGADNDELICAMSNPPLSSIDVSAERVGYEAAALLARLMRGEPAPPPDQPILIPPGEVIVRQSSDALAISDPDVAAAMRFIREHRGEPIQVDDVVEATHASRRVLERRFKKLLGRTIGTQIAMAHIDRAKGLLADTDLPTSQIAERSGYAYVQQFNALFKRHAGITPTAYRRRFRMR